MTHPPDTGNDRYDPTPAPCAGERREREHRALPMAVLAMFAGAVLVTEIRGGATDLWGGRNGDRVTPEDAFERMAQLLAAPPVGLPPVSPEALSQAVASMVPTGPERDALVADVQSKAVRLVWLSLYDWADEDGDAVTIRSGGYSRLVALRKSGNLIAVPAPADGFVTITGTVDGAGGGVTVGVARRDGVVSAVVLSVGQSIKLPVHAE